MNIPKIFHTVFHGLKTIISLTINEIANNRYFVRYISPSELLKRRCVKPYQ